MAGTKRVASKAAGARGKKRASPVAKKCATIAPSIRDAESLPKPVRKMISDRLVHAFGTYKEDRHPFQKTVSDLVGKALKASEKNLQTNINDANAKKAAQEAEGSTLISASDQANAASEAAAQTVVDNKASLADCSAACRSAKTALHDLEAEVAAADAEASSTAAQKEKLEALIKEFFTPVKEGTLDKGLNKSAAYAGRFVGKEFEASFEPEFIACVVRTFSKAASAWGTFDHIVDKELDGGLQKIVASLAADLAKMEGAKEGQAASVEAAKGAVAAAEEKAKAAEEALIFFTNAAKSAKDAAKTAAAAAKVQHQALDKAEDVCAKARSALQTFQEGPLAAYAEVEAFTAPPPEPEQPVTEQTAALDAAMMPAPPVPAATVQAPAPSPLIAFAARAMGISPRIASPRVA